MLMTGLTVSDESLIVIRDHSTLSVVKGGKVTVFPSSVTDSLVIVVGVGSVYGGNITKQGTAVQVTTGELTSQTSLNVIYEPLTADEVGLVDDVCMESDIKSFVLDDALNVRNVSWSLSLVVAADTLDMSVKADTRLIEVPFPSVLADNKDEVSLASVVDDSVSVTLKIELVAIVLSRSVERLEFANTMLDNAESVEVMNPEGFGNEVDVRFPPVVIVCISDDVRNRDAGKVAFWVDFVLL